MNVANDDNGRPDLDDVRLRVELGAHQLQHLLDVARVEFVLKDATRASDASRVACLSLESPDPRTSGA